MPTLAAALLFGMLLLAPVRAEPRTDQAARPDPPGLSGAMKETQLGHIKLWFAGKLGNWKLAAYEFDQIAPLLEQAASRFPASEEQVAKQVAALRNAIKAKDTAGFSQAYTELTNGCNSCHRSSDREFINIQIPAASPFTDQDFVNRVAEGRTLARTICGICHAVPDKPNVPLGLSFSAPSFLDLARRPSFTEANVRGLLASNHRRVGPHQAMPNPRLTEDQIEEIVAYFEDLRAELESAGRGPLRQRSTP